MAEAVAFPMRCDPLTVRDVALAGATVVIEAAVVDSTVIVEALIGTRRRAMIVGLRVGKERREEPAGKHTALRSLRATLNVAENRIARATFALG